MAIYSRGGMEERLRRLREGNTLPRPVAPVAEEMMPEDLNFKPFDQSMRFQNLDNIERRGSQETALVEQMVANQRAKDALARAQRQRERAQNQLERAENRQPKYQGPNIVGGNVNMNVGGNYTGERNFGKRWGKDNTPEVSDLKRINSNAMLTGVNYRGRHFVVSRQVAPIFVALLDDLWARGYRPKIIGGYNDRNIAGTNRRSLHSYGLAIDIDPERNPVQYGSNRHALPKNVSALAAKYGLAWGGDWRSYKDPMHFSVPFRGTE